MHHDRLKMERCYEKSGCWVMLCYWNAHSLDHSLFRHHDYYHQWLQYKVLELPLHSGHSNPKPVFNLSLLAHCSMGIEKNLAGRKYSRILVGNWGPWGWSLYWHLEYKPVSVLYCQQRLSVSSASRGIMEQWCFFLAFFKLILAHELNVVLAVAGGWISFRSIEGFGGKVVTLRLNSTKSRWPLRGRVYCEHFGEQCSSGSWGKFYQSTGILLFP